MSFCYDCKQELPDSEFYHNVARSNGLDSRCKPCAKQRNKDREGKLRAEIKVALGSKCLDCGKTEGWLEVHHLQFDGREHRLGGASTSYYQDILASLEDYALLCRSCHTYRHLAHKQCVVEESKHANTEAPGGSTQPDA